MRNRFRSLPEACRIVADRALDRALVAGAAAVAAYDDEALYDLAVQSEVRDTVRSTAPEGFDALIASLRRRLGRRPYCALVGGLSFHREERLFIALNRALGELLAPPLMKPRAQLVHRIQPSTDLMSSRGKHQETERLHTDCADWPVPSRVLSMACVRPDPTGGGDSLLLDRDSLIEDLEERCGAEVVTTLETVPVPWQLAGYMGGDVQWQPILGGGELRWRRYTIEAALARPEVALDPAMIELLERVEELIESSRRTIRFRLESGELLVMDNRRAIHSRMPLGESKDVSRRLMLRSWVQPPPEAPPAAAG